MVSLPFFAFPIKTWSVKKVDGSSMEEYPIVESQNDTDWKGCREDISPRPYS